jgi:hypothetical protein
VVERGLLAGAGAAAHLLLTGAPLLAVFRFGTQTHFFARALLAGAAAAPPPPTAAPATSVLPRHEPFARVFRDYASSHLLRAAELLLLLVAAELLRQSEGAAASSLAVWAWPAALLVACWLAAPLWFNPMALDWETVARDVRGFWRWLRRRERAPRRSWRAWFLAELAPLRAAPLPARVLQSAVALRFAAVGLALLRRLAATGEELVLHALLAVAALLLLVAFNLSTTSRYARLLRACQVSSMAAAIVGAAIAASAYDVTPARFGRSLVVEVALALCATSLGAVALLWGASWAPLLRAAQALHAAVGFALLAAAAALGALVLPGYLQTRVVFGGALGRGLAVQQLLREGRAGGSRIVQVRVNPVIGGLGGGGTGSTTGSTG